MIMHWEREEALRNLKRQRDHPDRVAKNFSQVAIGQGKVHENFHGIVDSISIPYRQLMDSVN